MEGPTAVGSMQDTPRQPDPVSRKRRATFVFCVVAAAFVTSLGLAMSGTDTAIAGIVAGKMLDLAQVLGVIYVSASAFDYSVGSAMKWNWKNKNMSVGNDK